MATPIAFVYSRRKEDHVFGETTSARATREGDARVELSDGVSLICPINEIEQSEPGIRVGARFLPWHRVLRYSWHLDSTEGRSGGLISRMRVRVIFEDGSLAGEIYEVTVDQFEAGPWTLNLITETASDDGTTTRRKLYVPWRLVREYERLPTAGSDTETVIIPDAED